MRVGPAGGESGGWRRLACGSRSALPILAVLAGLTACGSAREDADPRPVLCFGSLGPISIAKNTYEASYLAMHLALEQANDAGGLPIGDTRYRLELLAFDDRGRADVALERAEELHERGCPVILGPGYSSVALGPDVTYDADHVDGLADYAISHGMVLISPSATAAALTDLADEGYVSRTVASDALQGAIAAEYVHDVREAHTAAIIYRDDAWGVGLATVFAARFEELGGRVVAGVPYPASGVDFTTFDFGSRADAAFAERPDVVYLASFQTDGAKLTIDLARHEPADYRPLFISADGLREKAFLENGHPDILEGLIGTFPSADTSSPGWAVFEDQFTRRFGYPPQPFSQPSYDAAMLALLAMAEAGSTDPAVFKAHVPLVSRAIPGDVQVGVGELAKAFDAIGAGHGLDYDGATGRLELDDAGDPGVGVNEIWEIRRDPLGRLVTETIAVINYGAQGIVGR